MAHYLVIWLVNRSALYLEKTKVRHLEQKWA